jgi:hypothetical protein
MSKVTWALGGGEGLQGLMQQSRTCPLGSCWPSHPRDIAKASLEVTVTGRGQGAESAPLWAFWQTQLPVKPWLSFLRGFSPLSQGLNTNSAMPR